MKALLASPAPAAAVALTSHLRDRAGWRVSQAEDGERALELAGEQRPEVVIFDERVRDLDGPEFARRLLAVDAAIHLAVISPRPEDAVWERYEGMGLAACLPDQPGRAEAERLVAKLAGLGAA